MRGGVIWPHDATVASLDVPVTGLSRGTGSTTRSSFGASRPGGIPLRGSSSVTASWSGAPAGIGSPAELDFHGVVRSLEGTVIDRPAAGRHRSSSPASHAFDIRDFDIASPTVLMLRIYPDVTVKLQVEAVPVGRARSVS